MSNKNITNYDGLYGELNSRHSSEYIFLELIATRSQTFDWLIQPHLHLHLFQVFFVEKGAVLFQEVVDSLQVQAPCIFLVPPTMLHGLQYSSDVNGYILTLSENVVEDIFQTSSTIWKSLETIQVIKIFEENPFEKILNLIKCLETELFSEQEDRLMMLKAQLTQIFISLHRMAKHDKSEQHDSRTLGYFRKFQKLIKNTSEIKSVAELAGKLNITAVHLNRVCREISGKSPLELVHENIIIEAQKYLLHTSYSVSEIAYLLKFEYPNYFSRFFKKRVGILPSDFRTRNK